MGGVEVFRIGSDQRPDELKTSTWITLLLVPRGPVGTAVATRCTGSAGPPGCPCSLRALSRAAGAIGDTEEEARCAQFLRESSAEAAQNLGF